MLTEGVDNLKYENMRITNTKSNCKKHNHEQNIKRKTTDM